MGPSPDARLQEDIEQILSGSITLSHIVVSTSHTFRTDAEVCPTFKLLALQKLVLFELFEILADAISADADRFHQYTHRWEESKGIVFVLEVSYIFVARQHP